MQDETIKILFGKNGIAFIPIIKSITSTLKSYEYEFLEEKAFDKLMKTNQVKAMNIYWREIIMRAHFSAITTLLRSQQWINGAILAYESHNYLSFMATFRGFLESAVDSFDALSSVPIALAENFNTIESIITEKNRTAQIIISKELEDTLIHFSHGKKTKKADNAPDSHKAKTIRDYISSLERKDSSEIGDCYSELCESTHPAGQSVYVFTEIIDSKSGKFTFSQTKDKINIESFCNRHKNIFDLLFQAQFNTSLFILRILNSFSIKEFETESINSISLKNIKGWRKIENYLPNKI